VGLLAAAGHVLAQVQAQQPKASPRAACSRPWFAPSWTASRCPTPSTCSPSRRGPPATWTADT